MPQKPVGFFRSLRQERQALGWRGLVRKRGWVFVALILLLYLVRDLVLFVLIPLAVAAGLSR